MFDGRTNLALQVAEEVKRYFPGKVYATVIPRNVRLSARLPATASPSLAYDRTSRGAEAYTRLRPGISAEESGLSPGKTGQALRKEPFSWQRKNPPAWAGAWAPFWGTKR